MHAMVATHAWQRLPALSCANKTTNHTSSRRWWPLRARTECKWFIGSDELESAKQRTEQNRTDVRQLCARLGHSILYGGRTVSLLRAFSNEVQRSLLQYLGCVNFCVDGPKVVLCTCMAEKKTGCIFQTHNCQLRECSVPRTLAQRAASAVCITLSGPVHFITCMPVDTLACVLMCL